MAAGRDGQGLGGRGCQCVEMERIHVRKAAATPVKNAAVGCSGIRYRSSPNLIGTRLTPTFALRPHLRLNDSDCAAPDAGTAALPIIYATCAYNIQSKRWECAQLTCGLP